MRRTERHHLKEDPLAAGVLAVRHAVAGGGAAGTIAGVTITVLVVVGGLYGWQQRRLAQSGELLATAMAVLEAPVANGTEGQSVTKNLQQARSTSSGGGSRRCRGMRATRSRKRLS